MRLTSALQVTDDILVFGMYSPLLFQESTANVDEWKRQLQLYKEENQRLKLRYQELEAIKAGSGTVVTDGVVSDELRREISLLKSRIEDLEKELMAQEKELQAANKSLKDKNSDPMVRIAKIFNCHTNTLSSFQIHQLNTLVSQFSLHVNGLNSVHKEMDKLMQSQKCT